MTTKHSHRGRSETIARRPVGVPDGGPLEDVTTSPNGFLSDKDSGGIFYVMRLA